MRRDITALMEQLKYASEEMLKIGGYESISTSERV